MNQRERDICRRVKDFREAIKWPQPAFAEEIGISRDKLASIEYGRTPLRYKIGVDICEVFDLNGEWVVTGNGPMHGGTSPILWVIEHGTPIDPRLLFSEVYDSDPEIFQVTEADYRPIQKEATPGFDPEAYLIKEVVRWFRRTKFRTPLEAELFARAVSEFSARLIKSNQRSGGASTMRISKMVEDHLAGIIPVSSRIPARIKNQDPVSSKDNLDTNSGSGRVGDMSSKDLEVPTWPQLKKAVARLTSERGQKKALADKLGVSRQVLGNWLSSDDQGAPDAELTLEVFRWVMERGGWKPK